MKILQVNKLYYPWVGGVEIIVQQISEGLHGHNDLQVEVLACSTSRDKRQVDEVNGVRVHRAKSLGIFWGMPISFAFLKLFKKISKDFDIVDFHHPFPLGDLAILFFKPKKLIVHYHSDIVRQKILSLFFKPLILNTLKKADEILVSNPNLIKTSPYLKRFKEKCEVVPFGVNFKDFESYSNDQEMRQNKEKYGDFVFFLGRLNYYKGINYLIEAVKDLNVNLVIAGEGNEKENLKRQVKELEIENKVFFLPFQQREKIINFFKAAKVFVLPSVFRSEAFGIVLIEAMACGVPVISTELGTGTSWVNQDEKTGFVVPPRDSKALREAIKKILSNKKLVLKMSQQAKKRAREKFSLKQMISRIEVIYHSLLKG